MQMLDIMCGYYYKGAMCCNLHLFKDGEDYIHLVNDYGETMFIVYSLSELTERLTGLLTDQYAE